MRSFLAVLLIIWVILPLYSQKRYYIVKFMGNHVGNAVESVGTVRKDGKCMRVYELTVDYLIKRSANDVLRFRTEAREVARCKDFFPIYFSSLSTEGGEDTLVIGKLSEDGRYMDILVEKGGRKTRKRLEIPPGTVFVDMLGEKYPPDYFLRPGRVKILDLGLMGVFDARAEATRDSTGYVLTLSYANMETKIVMDSRGDVKRTLLQNGIVEMIKVDNLPGLRLDKKEVPLLARSFVLNVGKRIKKPRKTKKVVFRMSGSVKVSRNLFQRVERKGKDLIVEVRNVVKGKADAGDLTPGVLENVDDPALKKLVKPLANIKDKRELVKKAVKLVYDFIENKNYGYGSLSSSEIIKKRAGDCTEHAVLLATILKYFHIPVKTLSGLILTSREVDNVQIMFFHQWNAVFLDGKWMMVDATMNLFPADASRIILSLKNEILESNAELTSSLIIFLSNREVKVVNYE